MNKIKLGKVLNVKRGMSLSSKYYSENGEKKRLTLGNFNYPHGGFKENTSKKDIFFVGDIKEEYILKKGDIITPLTEQVVGLLGETARIPEDDKYIQSGDIGLVIPDEKQLDKSFAYYLIASPIVKRQLSAGAQQTKIRHTSPDKIKDCEVWLPNINHQRKTGALLDFINNKIELNNKINTELEAIAKTIYDYWFLQFEFPNEEGKPYKSSGGKMVWNEELKREIPEGWEVVNLSSCIKSINTGLNPRKNFKLNTGKIKYITVKNINIDGSIDFSNCDTIDNKAQKLIQKRSDLSKGDILFASIAPLGRCYLLEQTPVDWNINESVFSIRPNDNISSYLLYYYLISDEFIKKATYSSVGSIFQGIRITTILNIKVVLPSKKIINYFDSKISSLVSLKYKRLQENQELTSLKDFLLPLLMNGQVGFKN